MYYSLYTLFTQVADNDKSLKPEGELGGHNTGLYIIHLVATQLLVLFIVVYSGT